MRLNTELGNLFGHQFDLWIVATVSAQHRFYHFHTPSNLYRLYRVCLESQICPNRHFFALYNPSNTCERPHHGRVCSAVQCSRDLYLRESFRLNAAEQRELNSRMEKKQMKEFMTVLCPSTDSRRHLHQGFSFAVTMLKLMIDVLETSTAMLRRLRQ